jgi:hypothetical protein
MSNLSASLQPFLGNPLAWNAKQYFWSFLNFRVHSFLGFSTSKVQTNQPSVHGFAQAPSMSCPAPPKLA